MSYMSQFGDHFTIPEFLFRNPWVDNSWGNDAMPRFHNMKLRICVWVNYDDPERREVADDFRFVVTTVDEEGHTGEADLLCISDEEKLKDFIIKKASELFERIKEILTDLQQADEALESALQNAIRYELPIAKNYIEKAIDELNTIRNLPDKDWR